MKTPDNLEYVSPLLSIYCKEDKWYIWYTSSEVSGAKGYTREEIDLEMKMRTKEYKKTAASKKHYRDNPQDRINLKDKSGRFSR